jgi:hypothetical protein
MTKLAFALMTVVLLGATRRVADLSHDWPMAIFINCAQIVFA